MSITSIPGWQNMTAAEIVAFAASRHETARPIPAQEARNWLRSTGLARIAITGGWTGTLVTLAMAEGADQQLRAGVEDLLAHLSTPGAVQVDTDKPENAAIIPLLIAVAGLDEAGVAALYALGGGRKHQAITIDEAAKAKAIQAARDQMAAILSPIAAKSTALNAWLDALDTSGMSVAEVEAYAADLLASDDGKPSQGGD